MENVAVLNRWAKLSCPKWNRGKVKILGVPVTEPIHKASRRFFRELYRESARKFWESPEGKRRSYQYKHGLYHVDTYPHPYALATFGNWEEDSSNEEYSLLSDQSDFILKHCTSYCAWKIFEETGKWPQRKTHDKIFHAKYWREFLQEAGYETITPFPLDGHHYVGIKPHDYGEFGEVVWFEKTVQLKNDLPNKLLVSTYTDKKYRIAYVDASQYLWIQIS